MGGPRKCVCEKGNSDIFPTAAAHSDKISKIIPKIVLFQLLACSKWKFPFSLQPFSPSPYFLFHEKEVNFAIISSRVCFERLRTFQIILFARLKMRRFRRLPPQNMENSYTKFCVFHSHTLLIDFSF